MFDSPSILRRLRETKDPTEQLKILDQAIAARCADFILVNCAEADLPGVGKRTTGYLADGTSVMLRGELPAPGQWLEQDGQIYFIASHLEQDA